MKTNAIPILLLLATLSGPAPAAADFVKTKIAVLDFELQGSGHQTEDMGKIVAEWLVTAFVNEGRFAVIERSLLEKVLSEQKLVMSGLLDSQSTVQLGKLLGVKAIISGSVMKLGSLTEVTPDRLRAMNYDGTLIAEWVLPGDDQEGVTLAGTDLYVAQDSGQIYRYLDFPPQVGTPPPAAPEPSTLGLAAGGLLGLLGYAWRPARRSVCRAYAETTYTPSHDPFYRRIDLQSTRRAAENGWVLNEQLVP